MVKEILYNENITKTGDDCYTFYREFKAELSTVEVEKNRTMLQRNVDTLKLELENFDIELEIKNQLKRMDNDKLIKQEAYNNFDKYFSDQIIEIKKNKDTQKIELKKFLDSFDKTREMFEVKIKTDLEDRKKQYENQLVEDSKMLDIYLKINCDEKDGNKE